MCRTWADFARLRLDRRLSPVLRCERITQTDQAPPRAKRHKEATPFLRQFGGAARQLGGSRRAL